MQYTATMNKYYIDANQLLEDSFRLAVKIYQSDFIPDLIVGIWRGGTPVAIAVHEYFEYMGLRPDHIAIRTSSYAGINERTKEVAISGLDYIYENTTDTSRLLIIDDVFDSGNSFRSILQKLEIHYGKSIYERAKIACPWYKPGNNITDLIPDYYLHETDSWLVFPHEIAGLSDSEIMQGKPAIGQIIR